MTILGYFEDQVGAKLAEVLSASHPINSIEHLKGRDKELETIRRSLYAPGRHIFIVGDRGVGKSSLAATAAFGYQSSDSTPIFVSGSPSDTFNTVIANIASQAVRYPRTENIKSTQSFSIQISGITIGAGTERSDIDIAAAIRSVGDAVEILSQIAERHSEKPVVVVDEFDAIRDGNERNMFAALLKQMGDRAINIKFIFTGIAKSLDELLGAHQSAHRQLETIELPKLGWEARHEIVESAVAAFGLDVDERVRWRIAMVSDGYPYYVHSITEKTLWAAFSAEDPVIEIGWDLFSLGLRDAISSINAELKRPYEKAVLHRDPEFEDIVWSTADHEDLVRSLKDMYESYKVIVAKRADGRTKIERSRYASQVRKLKGLSFGSVMRQEEDRPGWYSYREKMLRGYVRMQAEANGIELIGERPNPRQAMHVANARSGYRGSSLPPGVRTGRKISDLGGGS